MCRLQRTHQPIDMYPRAIQGIHTCVATLAFITIIGYRRPPVIRIRRISGSVDLHTRHPVGWAAVLGPAAPAARRLISARRSPRRHCWDPKCVLPQSNLVQLQVLPAPSAPPALRRLQQLPTSVSAVTCARIQPPVAEMYPPTAELVARWGDLCHLEHYQRYLRRLLHGEYLYKHYEFGRPFNEIRKYLKLNPNAFYEI